MSGSISNKFDRVDTEEVLFKGYVYGFPVDYDAIDKYNILNIRKYLIIENNIKCLNLFLKTFIVLLASLVNASNHTKCVSLSNPKCEIQHCLINLHMNEYN